MLNVERTASPFIAREAAYLTERLGGPEVCRKVLDTGSGTGERAIALARSGFEVIAFEPGPEAIASARLRAEADGVSVRWMVGDPFNPDEWPQADADAVICPAWWTSSRDPQRTLRRLRQHVAPGVRLILSVPIEQAGHDMQGLSDVVRRAGFAIERLDVDFGCRRPANGQRSVQVVARSLAMPPDSLAVTAWGSDPAAPVRLDLRYEPDEADFLDPRPADVWREASAGANADPASHYAVDDPFGAARGTAAVARFFGCDLSPAQVTFGAGITSLLHDLVGLADGGVIVSHRLVHGDLEAWAMARGVAVHVLQHAQAPDDLERAVAEIRPALLHLDRPGFTGMVTELDDIERLARAASRSDTAVLIDEAALPYLGPAASAATLVNRVPNLVVLRGFTKAYSWGGLRAGFAVASDRIARHVRELVAPLQVAETSLAAAIRMLAAGDVFERLRRRIREVKPPAMTALERAGFSPYPGHPDLPWIALAERGTDSSRTLMLRGIRPLAPTPHPSIAAPSDVIRITLPLSEPRFRLLLALLESSTGESHA